jgi:hypothetical protein
MIRVFVMGAVCLALAGCGGTRAERTQGGTVRVATASGQVSQACLQAGRRAANPQLCGCVQAVADAGLSRADQALAASFFADPHQAQVIRQSDDPRHEAFWQRYKDFVDRAERTCRGL